MKIIRLRAVDFNHNLGLSNTVDIVIEKINAIVEIDNGSIVYLESGQVTVLDNPDEIIKRLGWNTKEI